MQRFAVSQKNRTEAITISAFSLSLLYSAKNREFSTLRCKNRRRPTEAECRLFCCPILPSSCRFCSFLKLLSYRHTAEDRVFAAKNRSAAHVKRTGVRLRTRTPAPRLMPGAVKASVHNRQPQISYIRNDPGGLCTAGVVPISDCKNTTCPAEI